MGNRAGGHVAGLIGPLLLMVEEVEVEVSLEGGEGSHRERGLPKNESK